jgi:MFS family permease
MAGSEGSGVKPDSAFAVLLTASAGCAMTVLDANVVAIILQLHDLTASFAEIEWVVSAYVLCFTSLLPARSLADRFGRRKGNPTTSIPRWIALPLLSGGVRTTSVSGDPVCNIGRSPRKH